MTACDAKLPSACCLLGKSFCNRSCQATVSCIFKMLRPPSRCLDPNDAALLSKISFFPGQGALGRPGSVLPILALSSQMFSQSSLPIHPIDYPTGWAPRRCLALPPACAWTPGMVLSVRESWKSRCCTSSLVKVFQSWFFSYYGKKSEFFVGAKTVGRQKSWRCRFR